MKFPTLKHPWLCQHLLYSPAYLAFGSLFVPLILERHGVKISGPLYGLGVIVVMGLALWYLFHNIFLLFGSDVILNEIHSWQRDRLEYSSRVNGLDRATAQRRILRRCRLWGRKWKDGADERFTVYYKHAYSWTVYHSMIEKRVVLCQTEHLDAEQYHILLGQARHQLSRLPDGTVRFHTKQEKRAPRAYVSLVVILADRVDEDVKANARLLPVNTDDAAILPCVVECPTGHYYMNGGKQSYEAGMMGRPAQNYARGMARRLVFARGLPKSHPEKLPPCEMQEYLDMSLWEYVRKMRSDIKEERTGEEKERVKMLRRLHEGEVKLGEYAVYCKLQGRVAEWCYLPEEEDEKTITLLPGNTWYYQKDSLKYIPGLRNDYNRRKMKPDQVNDVDRRIRAALQAQGYHILKENEA